MEQDECVKNIVRALPALATFKARVTLKRLKDATGMEYPEIVSSLVVLNSGGMIDVTMSRAGRVIHFGLSAGSLKAMGFADQPLPGAVTSTDAGNPGGNPGARQAQT